MAKPFINPLFITLGSVIALVPFRYLWNNPPSFVGKSLWLAFFTPVIAFFAIAFGVAYLMTAFSRLWKSK